MQLPSQPIPGSQPTAECNFEQPPQPEEKPPKGPERPSGPEAKREAAAAVIGNLNTFLHRWRNEAVAAAALGTILGIADIMTKKREGDPGGETKIEEKELLALDPVRSSSTGSGPCTWSMKTQACR